MSFEFRKVEEFVKKIGKDQALQAEVGKALEAPNYWEALTALANSKGYDFSSEELKGLFRKLEAEYRQKEADEKAMMCLLFGIPSGVIS